MPQIPDLSDPRYLDEVGWFLYHEKYRRDRFGGSYHAERLAHSRLKAASRRQRFRLRVRRTPYGRR